MWQCYVMLLLNTKATSSNLRVVVAADTYVPVVTQNRV